MVLRQFSSRIFTCRLLLSAIVLLLSMVPETRVSADEPPVPTIIVRAQRFSFTPNQITLKKGQPVKLIFLSEDVPHGLSVKGIGLRAEIHKGQRTEVSVTPAETGDFPGRCSVYCGSGHRDMEFLVRVVE
ncbi:quinol oxidase [Acidisarcina polymorpha]|uniref:Quinol oxidase n=1 Tax=Acidisarcina polymorpha TaxID=2211140 RepID=A0A2Z5FX00_9BACT|nr:cupredoxin domain-containing protein [Acidisarcina polymorpha]AXC10915.1 quinol oxidase [Acidisarcina polymorpha]